MTLKVLGRIIIKKYLLGRSPRSRVQEVTPKAHISNSTLLLRATKTALQSALNGFKGLSVENSQRYGLWHMLSQTRMPVR